VGPPSVQCQMWWMSHHLAGRSQPGWVQCRSRAITARLIAAGTTRVVRPMSTGSPAGPNTIRLIVLSQQIRRMSSRVRTFAKVAEGKTSKEAIRALKRRISDVVYRRLVADAQRTIS